MAILLKLGQLLCLLLLVALGVTLFCPRRHRQMMHQYMRQVAAALLLASLLALIWHWWR